MGCGFCKEVFEAEFSLGFDIADENILCTILSKLGQDPVDVFEQALDIKNKQRLKEQTDQAERQGFLGAPSFITPAGELFWGDDRLEQALDSLAA